MNKIKVLNLYAGVGGNRKLWPDDEIEVTAVEIIPEIANVYKELYPNDKVIIGDAHDYLLKHFKKYDFIWSSPPCPTHSKLNFSLVGVNGYRYPSMILYEEIIFLKTWFKGLWVVENVVSYYDPLIKPYIYESHYYWSNFIISGKDSKYRGMNTEKESLQEHYNLKKIDLSKFKNIDKKKCIRNCVDPDSGLKIFNMAFKEKQIKLYDGEVT